MLSELEIKVIKNRKELTVKKQGLLNGNAKVGDPNAVTIGYIPMVCGIQLGDDWFKTEESALERGNQIIDYLQGIFTGGAQTTPQDQGFTAEEAAQIEALAREESDRDVERILGEEDEKSSN